MRYMSAAAQTWLVLWGWHFCLAVDTHPASAQAGLPAPQNVGAAGT